MSNIFIFNGDFCEGSSVVKEVLERTGLRLVRDKDLLAAAGKLSGLSEQKLEKAFWAKTSVFNKFTHEKERSLAYMRLAMAEMIAEQGLLLNGYLGHFLPREISHFLKVCLIGDVNFRVSRAAKELGLAEKDALKRIAKLDGERAHWTSILCGTYDPWASSLYDIVIPMDKSSIKEAADLIEEHFNKDAVKPGPASQKKVEDFTLAARAMVALAQEGHNVEVKACDGVVTVTVNKNVLMLSRLEEELKEIISREPGVNIVEVVTGKEFYRADIYRKFDFETPSKVLLVDDEREFVQTLSERLLIREMGSTVVHDGQSALKLIAEDEPDVMVLDLKMPGIDGIEVLRRVKKTRPEVEVIILTGHGSEADQKTCMELGAFAYLQKPVDIDILGNKLREANDKIRKSQKSKKEPIPR